MATAVPIPPGLADLPPGPELGAVLAGIDLSQVPNASIIDVLRAESRQLAHQQARLFAAMAEVGRSKAATGPDVVARSAVPLVEAIQEIGPALVITTRATFAEHDLAEQLRTRLPAVLEAMLAGLIDRSKARLFVEHARQLNAHQIALLCADLLPLAPHLTTGQLNDRLRKWCLAVLDPETLRKRYQRAVQERGVCGHLNQDGTATISASGLPPAEAAAACDRLFELARTIRRSGHPDTLPQIRADLFVALLDGSLQQMTTAQIVAAMLARRNSSRAEARPGIEVRIQLSTLMGLDELPAEIPGWGAVLPHQARDVAAHQRAGEWRFAITDADGHLLLAGLTRRRPPAEHEVRQNAGGIVELQVPLELLRRLAAAPPPGWELLIADLASQYARRHELRTILRAYPDARFPHAALRRHIEIRDRTCVFPGCRRPARQVQQDHTVAYRDGGATVEVNLGPLCVLHHAMKTAGGWVLRQTAPGRFTWRSPLGQIYRTRGEPIVPPRPPPI